MSASGGVVVHLYGGPGAPRCGTCAGSGALYAIDDEGLDVPAWVTCQRCLSLLGSSQGCRPGGTETRE
jgi:hypothetical protein